MRHTTAYKCGVKDFAPVQSTLRERLIVNLRPLASDSRWQHLLVLLWRTTLITQIGNFFLTVLFAMVFEQHGVVLVVHKVVFQHVLLDDEARVPAIRSVSCVASSLPSLTILAIFLACYCTTTIQLHKLRTSLI